MCKDHSTKQRHQRGITLLELIVTLSIVAIMVTAAAPSFQDVLNRTAETAVTNVFVSGMLATRTYAVTHKQNLVLQAIDGDWNNGFQVNIGNGDGEVLSQSEFTDSEIEVSFQPSAQDVEFLSFDRLGRVTPPDSQFSICNALSEQAVEVSVSYFGKAEIARDGEGNIDYTECVTEEGGGSGG